jgi:hypothetical protein
LKIPVDDRQIRANGIIPGDPLIPTKIAQNPTWLSNP